jgi:tRNA(Arg) A34 adenosine deaminase TadA
MAYHVIRKYAANRYEVNRKTYSVQVKPITKRWIKGFEAAINAAKNSDGRTKGMQLGAVVFHGNRLLGSGWNLFSKTKPGNSHRNSKGYIYNTTTHAEQMAIDQIKHYDYSNAKLILYVARTSAVGKMVCSRPCNTCIDYMKEHGIRIVRFINEQGIPEELVIK